MSDHNLYTMYVSLNLPDASFRKVYEYGDLEEILYNLKEFSNLIYEKYSQAKSKALPQGFDAVSSGTVSYRRGF